MGPRRADFVLRCDGLTATLACDENVLRTWDDPLEALRWMGRGSFEDYAPLSFRWVGFLSYDLGRLFERIPTCAIDDLGTPLFAFGLYHACTEDYGRMPLLTTSAAATRSTFS